MHPLAPTATHVYGAISLIFWSLMMVVTLKYVLLILRADNHGEGGIMALVALIERSMQGRRKLVLITVGILGASLFYGDGMLTPAISVVSAVSGLQVASPALAAQIVPFSLAILVALFALQRFGTGADRRAVRADHADLVPRCSARSALKQVRRTRTSCGRCHPPTEPASCSASPAPGSCRWPRCSWP